MLKPWSTLLDLGDSSLINLLGRESAMQAMLLCIETERRISLLHTNRYDFDLADFHAQRALTYAKRFQGKEDVKANLLYLNNTNYCNLRMIQDRYKDAVPFAEEAYNIVAEVYNPVNTFVLSAAGSLIECLIHTNSFYDAGISSALLNCFLLVIYLSAILISFCTYTVLAGLYCYGFL
jgi:hypothetical protein